MTNEIKTEVGNIVDSAAGAVKQLTTTIDQWPISVLIVAVLVLVIIVLRTVEQFPNNRILLVIVLLGGVMNGIMGSTKSVASDQAYPSMVLAFKGMLLGFIAAAIHSLLIKRFEKKFPILRGKMNGDTVLFNRKEIEKKEGIKFDDE